MHRINSIANEYKEVNATIWLLTGDHFFFFCSEVAENPMNIGEAGSGAPLLHNNLCALESMKASYPKTDNVNLVVRALACDSPEGRALDRARLDKRWFYTNCVKQQNKTHDERPVIHVNGPDFYFNITKSAVFEDVIFDGINAFGEVFTLQTAGGQQARKEITKVPYWPMKMCELAKPTGFEAEEGSTVLLDLLKENLGNNGVSSSA